MNKYGYIGVKPLALKLVLLLLSMIFYVNLCSSQPISIGKKWRAVQRSMALDNTNDFPVVTIIEKSDTLAFVRSPDKYPVEVHCYFRDGECNEQIIKIYCSECAKAYLDGIVNENKFNFRKLSDSYYFSKRKRHTLVKVIRDEDFEVCTKIILSQMSWSKSDYNEYEKKALKYNNQ